MQTHLLGILFYQFMIFAQFRLYSIDWINSLKDINKWMYFMFEFHLHYFSVKILYIIKS